MNFREPLPHQLLFNQSIWHLQDSADNYVLGGYHPAFVGEVLSERYVLLRKLSQGQYASVWLAEDIKHQFHVAVKVFKASPCYNDIAIEEVEMLQTVYKRCKEAKWQAHLRAIKKKLNLSFNTHIFENFCVKLTKKVPKLFSAQRTAGKPLLHRVRVLGRFAGRRDRVGVEQQGGLKSFRRSSSTS